jgi:hypothetical protein
MLAPKVLEPVRRHLDIAHRVLNILVAEPSLQCSRVVTGICQGIAAGMSQHGRKDREGHAPARSPRRANSVPKGRGLRHDAARTS